LCLQFQFGGLFPLHYGCLLPGEDGVTIVELLLNALADPDSRAEADDSYLNHYLVMIYLHTGPPLLYAFFLTKHISDCIGDKLDLGPESKIIYELSFIM